MGVGWRSGGARIAVLSLYCPLLVVGAQFLWGPLDSGLAGASLVIGVVQAAGGRALLGASAAPGGILTGRRDPPRRPR